MNGMSDTTHWLLLSSAWIGPTVYAYTLHRRIKKDEKQLASLAGAYNDALKLIQLEIERRDAQVKAFQRLTNQELIMEDMEKGARMREMRDANRNLLPRPDAGPPAKVYTPTLRAKVPRSTPKKSTD